MRREADLIEEIKSLDVSFLLYSKQLGIELLHSGLKVSKREVNGAHIKRAVELPQYFLYISTAHLTVLAK